MDTPLPPDGKRRRSGEQRAHRRRKPPLFPPGAIRHWAPIIVFALLTLFAPILFGAEDRIVQIGLLVLLSVGIILRPPALVPLSHRANLVVIALLAILVLKEFAPWQWFGATKWRTELGSELYALSLPKTHHPEPQRALDALLAGVIGMLWFQWTRTLASERGARRVMGWVLFGAGVAVAVVCFAMGKREVSSEGGLIYGLRFTTSWVGWGPFPNKNHTASFLAMAFLVGCGCVAWAIVKRRISLVVTGLLGLMLVGGALLASRSRGGLLFALGGGLSVFSLFILVRFFSARTLVLVVTAGTLILTAVMLFGGDVVARFQSHDAGSVSNDMRVAVWKDTLLMWRDAPLFGHGLGSFAQLFPLYQTVELDGAYARHPESSWLAWLAELGVVPLAIVIFSFIVFVAVNIRAVLERRGGFFISLGALAAFVGFLAHCAIDVPAHRWATAGFALALLAVAFPVRSPDAPVPPSPRLSAFVPALVALFWVLPFVGMGSFSPMKPILLMERENYFALGGTGTRPPRPTLAEWQSVAADFPLDREIQQTTGLREVEAEIPSFKAGKPLSQQWQRRFDLVARLAPGLYGEAMQQAYAVSQLSKGLAIGYWQTAVDKARFEKNEILRIAIRETSSFPGATGRWDSFCAERPELLPVYASVLIEDLHATPAEVKHHFENWWDLRAMTAELTTEEREVFHRYGEFWATLDQVEQWIKRNGARRKQDYRSWAALLHKLHSDARAWEIMSPLDKEPAPVESQLGSSVESMRELMVSSPDNFSNIAALVSQLEKKEPADEARSLLIATAQRPNAPKWFLIKAAHAMAAGEDYTRAVELMLRIK